MRVPGPLSGVSAFAFLFAAVLAAQSTTTVNVQITGQVNTQVGVNGRLQVAMSTSFQLAQWSYQFFGVAPQALAPLAALFPFHTRVQAISNGIPLTAPNSWDFTELDTMLPPIQSVGDHSPELQIATAPAFMNDSSGHILPASFGDFALMCANLVRYFNTGGFNVSGEHFQSPTPYPITWWGIFNEPNGNGLTPEQYVNLYNTVVPLMAQADPSIKFVAVELSDYGTQAESFLPPFIANVTAPVDVAATHFYSSCNQKDLDADVLATVPGFADEVRFFYSQLATKPALAGVPVWVTEDNVNSDYNSGNGMSACNPGQTFVLDQRGTSSFFAGWQSLVFATLGEAGVQALYHWSFGTDAQFGEIDGSGNPYMSYWVDYYLSHWLPSPPGQDILQVNSSGCCLWIYKNQNPFGLDTHTLAARNVDGSVVILMSNHAIQTPLKDNNGPGAQRTFALDLSALGSFASATLVTLDAATPQTGPVPVVLPPAPQMAVTLPGYGAALLRLANAQPGLPATGIVNAASYISGPVAPGEIVSLFGTSIGPSTPSLLTLTNPRLVANSVAGLRVLFDGVPAPILYASSGQVNVVVPYSVAGRSSTQVQLDYLGALSRPVTLPVAAAAAGTFTLDTSGKGPGAIRNVTDESINSADNPASPGDWVSIYATGAGTTTPSGVDGLVASPPFPQADAKVSVTIGGLSCPVNYAGAAPGFVSGVLQVNAQVPAGVPPGSAVPVLVTIGNVPSQAGVTLAVR
jgi:uncharacterized protein (TIGR03437 family)